MNLIPRKTLFEYPYFLNEISFKDLEKVVTYTVNTWCDRDTRKEHKPIMIQIVISILFQLFIRMSANLRVFILNKHCNIDSDIPELVTFSNFQSLFSQIRTLKVLFAPFSKNVMQLLGNISTNLHCLDFKLHTSNYTPEVTQLISTIIKSQHYLSEFTIANVPSASNGLDSILSSLHSHKKSLNSLKLNFVHLTEPSINIINQFNKLHTLCLYCCGDVNLQILEKYGKSLKQPNSENYKKCENNVHSIFKYGKFGSAGQKDISRRYNGLIEKFRLHAQEEKADHLEKIFTSYINRSIHEASIPVHTRYDMLYLLLNLSESPLQVSFSLALPKSRSSKPQLTVEDIFREEPLTWIRERLGDRAINLQNSRRTSIQKNVPNFEQQNEKVDVLEFDIDHELIRELESKQYWRNEFRHIPEETKFNSNDACTLAPALAEYKSRDESYLFHDPTRVEYLTELVAIREVLFMLSGRPSYLFHQQENGKFQIKSNITLTHLSEGGFKALLDFFCDYGNKLFKLRMIASKICSEPCTLYGQTAQAFSASILKMVWKFDKLLADFELEYQVDRIKSRAQDTYISLLHLRSELMNRLYEFTIIHNFVEKSSLNDIPELCHKENTSKQSRNLLITPSKIAYDILSGLYDEISTHQTVGNHSIFLMLGKHLDNSFVPFIRMMNDWICKGAFHDPANEFFIVRTSIIQNSSQYWKEMYKIREVSSLDNSTSSRLLFPTFLEPFIGRVLFSGKAKNLLMSLKLKEEEVMFRMTFQHHPEEFEFDTKSLQFFDLSQPAELGPLNKSPGKDFMSALFPLWNKSKIQTVEYTEPRPRSQSYIGEDDQHLNIDPMINFQPFTERFREKFEDYLHPRYMRIGQQLYGALVEQCHLWRHLRALAGIYFMQQGESMHLLTDVLFDRIDKKQMWYDSYVLNEVVLNTIKNFKWLDKSSVIVWVNDEAGKKPNIKTVRVFEKIAFEYRLPWPLDNIIRSNTLTSYKRIIVFLLQVKRAKYLLERLSFSRNQDNSKAMVLFYGVRMKLIWFLNTIWDYAMRTILLSETENFYKKLEQVFDIDEMISLHGNYIRTVHDRCLLNENATPMHKSILDVLDLIIQFSILYTRYRGDNVSFYDHSRDDRSRRFMDDNSDSDSDSFLIDDDDDQLDKGGENGFESIVPHLVDYDDFLNGLCRIDKEFNRHKEFISNSIQAIAKVGGFWWFDALALALG
ncbi:11354_t:CDS:10 [Funneliformis mosseae]|uniref:11354_t:CDS:1 n=1 Tax=Funneliformis mosseae TaxID=27381 RepID=A0A9N9BWU8_FUNMO|nr:11354_t:CDS:10 [Funneliformis mosseae]